MLYECLKVVAACHGEGLVHGDVKPANFLLKQHMRNPLALIESGSVRSWLKAIDFGCSQDTRGAQLSRRTGTPGVLLLLLRLSRLLGGMQLLDCNPFSAAQWSCSAAHCCILYAC